MTSLSASETQQRFGVSKEIAVFPTNLTKQEEENVRVVLEYMDVRFLPLLSAHRMLGLSHRHTCPYLQPFSHSVCVSG